MRRSLVVLTVACALGGCRAEDVFVGADLDLNRMLEQPRVDPYEPDSLRVPPAGTVPWASEDAPDAAAVRTGRRGGAPVARIPVSVDAALLATGRARFDVFCAPCHGVAGDGRSVVARHMTLRPPTSLHLDRLRALAPGALYGVVAEGKGLMPAFAVQLTPRERWAVVAYVRALQLARHAPVARLPAPLRDRLEGAP